MQQNIQDLKFKGVELKDEGIILCAAHPPTVIFTLSEFACSEREASCCSSREEASFLSYIYEYHDGTQRKNYHS